MLTLQLLELKIITAQGYEKKQNIRKVVLWKVSGSSVFQVFWVRVVIICVPRGTRSCLISTSCTVEPQPIAKKESYKEVSSSVHRHAAFGWLFDDNTGTRALMGTDVVAARPM